jgi:hypothetical protein
MNLEVVTASRCWDLFKSIDERVTLNLCSKTAVGAPGPERAGHFGLGAHVEVTGERNAASQIALGRVGPPRAGPFGLRSHVDVTDARTTRVIAHYGVRSSTMLRQTKATLDVAPDGIRRASLTASGKGKARCQAAVIRRSARAVGAWYGDRLLPAAIRHFFGNLSIVMPLADRSPQIARCVPSGVLYQKMMASLSATVLPAPR